MEDEEAARVAFELLTCSSIERYVRMSKQAAARSPLRRMLLTSADRIHEVLGHARRLLGELRRSSRRDVPEVELAVILALLAQRADGSEAEDLMIKVAIEIRPSCRWLSALARQLLHEGSSDTTIELPCGSRSRGQVEVTNAVATQEMQVLNPPHNPFPMAPTSLVA